MRLAVRSRHRAVRRAHPESGFTLMELLVVMMIISAVLFSLVAIQTSSLVTIAQSRQRSEATAIANQTMEELRALPWLTLSKGLNGNYAVLGADPNVSGSSLRLTSPTAVNETLVTTTGPSGQTTDVPPLSGAGGTNVTTAKSVENAGVSYTTRVYVTVPSTGPDSVLNLTVITTWQKNGKAASGKTVLRSAAYAPAGGCGDLANQPFLGACQAIMSSSAGSSGLQLRLTGANPPPPAPPAVGAVSLVPGSGVANISVRGDLSAVAIASQQSTAAKASVQHAQSVIGYDDGTSTPTTLSNAVNEASNDVGAAGAAPTNPADVIVIGPPAAQSASAGRFEISVTGDSSVTGQAKASTVDSCKSGIPAAAPCATTTRSGGTGLKSSLAIDGSPVVTLASSASGSSASSFTGRFAKVAGTTTVGCSVVTEAGCVSAGSERQVASSAFASASWAGGQAPNGLVTLQGYYDTILVNRGASQKSAAATTSRVGTVSIWNGSGYDTVTLTPSLSTSKTSPTVTTTAPGVTVTASATVQVSPAVSKVSAVDPSCVSSDCTIDSNAGSITVTVTYVVTDGGGASWSFVAQAVLEGSQATASYKAAPLG